ncbi:hypothetical protein RJ40_02440 [Methanofollis aquaemaris]|uniref:Uncharacterized protein n=1 Tax=Methanofollis aquaemaris TaxID=126734 RepID=A0A8A3S467_9EURY|nr:hypothetical protein [Methanofollis aquaemaris]QSZ66436.1 hypothetical protein RJ40_02440 [Methanofollis aquaemaris]
MGRPGRHLVAGGFITWLFAVTLFLVLMKSVDLMVFLVLVSIGFFILVEVLDTTFVRPSHVLYLKYLVAAGLVVFGTVIIDKVARVLI